MIIGRTITLCVAAVILSVASASDATPLRIPETTLEPVAFADLDGWAEDDHAAAFMVFRHSCRAIDRSKEPPGLPRAARAVHDSLREVCTRALKLDEPVAAATARSFFEENFRPVRISRLGERDGFLTGYYEPEVEGSLTPGDGFVFPVYRRPAELVARAPKVPTIQRPARSAASKKTKIGKRQGRRLLAYYDRAAIEDGALASRGLEICWLKDPADAFFIHIQGSARIRLRNGRLLRLNYAAQNGHAYLPVGRVLAERGIVPIEEMTMDKIRTFIAENAEEGRELMRMNRSFIFFREVVELPTDAEPIGAQGVPLTRDRSIAVDKSIHVYGTPFWIEGELPIERENGTTRFRRLMVAQDTGGAIVGPARADIYFGAGVDAGTIAGRMRHPGRVFVLVPRTADPARLAENMPLPLPRPNIPEPRPKK